MKRRGSVLVCVCSVLVLLAADEDAKSHQYVQESFYFDVLHDDSDWPGNNAARICFLFGLCSWWKPFGTAGSQLTLIYGWGQLEYDYRTPADRQAAINNGDFTPGMPIPIDVDVYYTGGNNDARVFVTSPRFMAGVPAALSVLSQKQLDGNPVLTPYPNWSWFRSPRECRSDRITSVYRIKIDECGRLWVLDNGRYLDKRICPAQILAFDLRTDRLVHRFEIPDDQLTSASILVTLAVDVRDPQSKCRNTFVYAADCQGNSLIVHDVQRSISWKATDKTMWPYPNYGTFDILGDQFDLMDGILGMDLSPYKQNADRTLFYHAMSSPTENRVSTSVLRNQTLFGQEGRTSQYFRVYSGLRSSQSAAEAIDKDGIMYFGTMSDTSLNCWDTAKEYGGNNIKVIENNPQTLQFLSGIKVINNQRGEQELWFMTNRFQKLAAGTMNPKELNYRIQGLKLNDVKSKCRGRPGGGRPHHGHRPKPKPQSDEGNNSNSESGQNSVAASGASSYSSSYSQGHYSSQILDDRIEDDRDQIRSERNTDSIYFPSD